MKFNTDDFEIYTLFGDLKGGETFYYEPSGVIWMKLCESENFYNRAVALDDGVVAVFDDYDHVIKVDIECKITFSPIKKKTINN